MPFGSPCARTCQPGDLVANGEARQVPASNHAARYARDTLASLRSSPMARGTQVAMESAAAIFQLLEQDLSPEALEHARNVFCQAVLLAARRLRNRMRMTAMSATVREVRIVRYVMRWFSRSSRRREQQSRARAGDGDPDAAPSHSYNSELTRHMRPFVRERGGFSFGGAEKTAPSEPWRAEGADLRMGDGYRISQRAQ